MVDSSQIPKLVKPIPAQVINEAGTFGPLDLKRFIQTSDPDSGALRFSALLESGTDLPTGLVCSVDGVISGSPIPGTAGEYTVEVTADNDSGVPLKTKFVLSIKTQIVLDDPLFLARFKAQVWESMGENLPIPEMAGIFNRPIMPIEIYYILQRFATLTIWDIYNLEPPGEKIPLKLEGCSKYYNVFDRGSCLIGAPKSLYSLERTLQDTLQTAKVVAREAYKRGWTIEFAGFNKMVRAAWVELQLLGDKHGNPLEILHYTPSNDDMRIYTAQARGMVSP